MEQVPLAGSSAAGLARQVRRGPLERRHCARAIRTGPGQRVTRGRPQGATVSPLLANVYLHYVLDLWAHQWRRRHAHGDVVIVRFADDFIAGFEHQCDAERFLADLRERLAKFALELQTEKTRLIEFGRTAAQRRRARGARWWPGAPFCLPALRPSFFRRSRSGDLAVLRFLFRPSLDGGLDEFVEFSPRRRLSSGITHEKLEQQPIPSDRAAFALDKFDSFLADRAQRLADEANRFLA